MAVHSSEPRRRSAWVWIVMVVVVLVVAGVVSVGVVRLARPLPVATVATSVPPVITVPGPALALPWPSNAAAVSIPALGYHTQSAAESPVPVASLTKMTTAVLILRDHPIAAGASGPMITITAADVAEYASDRATDQSALEVQVGEVLSEQQMLQALLIRSANNISLTLAVWDAGSESAFVVKMNALAVSLGMTNSQYVDASGYQPQSVSTAADCLRIAAVGMAIPAFAAMVAMPSATFPLVGTVPNIVTQVGSGGVIGIKSGFTSQAGGCMVLASARVIDGQSVLVLAALTGQPVALAAIPEPVTLEAATTADLLVLNAAKAAIRSVAVATVGKVVGAATSTWGGAARPTPVVDSATVTIHALPGQVVSAATATIAALPANGGGRGGEPVGTTTFSLGTQHRSAILQLSGPIDSPSWWWRVLHG